MYRLSIVLAALTLLSSISGCATRGTPAVAQFNETPVFSPEPIGSEPLSDAAPLSEKPAPNESNTIAEKLSSTQPSSVNVGNQFDSAQTKLEIQRTLGKVATPSVESTEPLTLAKVLEQAAKNSPTVKAAEARWHAAQFKRPQVVALPDPRLEATYYVRQQDDQWMLGLSQDIPYPGKLILAGKIADKEALAAYWRYQASLRDVISDAKEAYFELSYIEQANVVTLEIKKLYERYAALGTNGLEAGQTKLPETFRAEAQVAQLANDLILLHEMRATEQERLKTILAKPSYEVFNSVAPIAEPPTLNVTLEDLQAATEGHNQELAAAGIEVERAELQTRLAKQAPIPNFTVGANYTRRTNNMDQNPIGMTFGVSIPLWVPKYKAMVNEAKELETAAKADREAVGLAGRASLVKAWFSLNNSARLVKLYRSTLIPQARQALQSAEELHRKGQANLSSVLETAATVQNFELARIRATVDFYQNIARIEKIVGTALELKPAAPVTPKAPENKEASHE